jgi:hypothetical protein
MEDLIYVIALIAWVAFSFYRKQQKKAEADRKMQRPTVQRTDSAPVPTWEDILLGEEPVPMDEPAPASAPVFTDGMSPVLKETSFEKEYKLRGINSVEEMNKPFRMSDFRQQDMKIESADDESMEREEWLSKFDLRRAVIYSEILNRPYV